MQYEGVISKIEKKLTAAGLLPLEAQAELSTRVLKDKLETVLPWAMKESGIDFWVVAGKEYDEDPIMKTLFTWDMPHARRTSLLMFHYDKETEKVSCMSAGSQSPEMSKLYRNVKTDGEDVFECFGRVVRELSPEKIGINKSDNFGFCDGINLSEYESISEAAGEFKERFTPCEELSVRWLERLTDLEKNLMKALAEAAQDIIAYTMSGEFVKPGVTSTTDIEWAMRNIINRLGFDFWFGPDVDLQRKDNPVSRIFGEVIEKGDILHCDIGIVGRYVQLNTDMQWISYIRKDGEEHTPCEISALFKKGNEFQDIVMKHFKEGRTGNEVFEAAVEEALKKGIKPMLYSHPVGTFGHGAGPSFGKYDHQAWLSGAGEKRIENETVYALELNVKDKLKLWDGQEVFMYLEENIFYDGGASFVFRRQEAIIEI